MKKGVERLRKERGGGFFNFLQQFELKEGVSDRWAWRGMGGEAFIVKSAYKKIMSRISSPAPIYVADGRFGGYGKCKLHLKLRSRHGGYCGTGCRRKRT